MQVPKPLVLVILDGFGVSLEKYGNPVADAKKPTLEYLEKNFPFTTLQASGAAVGLPWGEAGNSEVGHLTIGAGRVIHHHLPRIIQAVSDGSFFKNQALLQAVEHVRQNNSKLHIAGLVSSGSVHSYIDHLYALLELTQKENIKKVYLHAFTDGKDAHPTEAADFFVNLQNKIKEEYPNISIASVIGRNFALDRDQKWERIKKTFNLLTQGEGNKINSLTDYFQSQYKKHITDEFIEPAIIDTEETIGDNDAIIFSDFREDSMRELVHAFTDESFNYFERNLPSNLFVVTLTEYQKGLRATPAFPKSDISWPLARVLADEKLTQLHIAETQKYAHITYFLNGGREERFGGEERIVIPSIADQPFEEVPQMQAEEITKNILENFGKYDVIIANFANADTVGHTGNFDASIKAVEVLDECLKKLFDTILESDGAMIVTADHGNIEKKRDPVSGGKTTEHSINPVYFILIRKEYKLKQPASDEDILKKKKDVGGILIDIAPTILDILKLKKPHEMTGESLLPKLLENK